MRTGFWTLLMMIFFLTAPESRAADSNPSTAADGNTPIKNSLMNPLIMNPINIAQGSSNPAADADMAKKVIQAKGKLTLDIYLRAVDSNFPGLKAALDQQRIASAVRLEKQGVFDPLLSNESGYTRMQNTSKIGEAKYVTFNYPKIELPFRSGIRTFLQYRYNPLSSQSPYIETGKSGEISGGVFVPVMRGLIYNEQSVAEKEAKLGENLALQTFSLTRLDTLLKSGAVYWTWSGAYQKIKVASHILELAKLVVGISRQQEANGDLARIYVTEAEEDVERRDADLTQAKRDFQRSSFKLSAVLFDLGGTPLPLPDEINCPDEMPRPQEFSEEDSERSVILALTRRPELKAIDVQVKMAELQRKLAENQLLPSLNAVITAGHDGGIKGIGRTYRGQLTFSQPVLMRTARGKLQAAKLRIDKLKKDRAAEEQRIRNEVYDAISAINLSFQRFAALERQVEKANLVYLGEKERLQAGDSTVFLVTERERQLNEARMRTIDAQVEYHNGLLALRAITAQM